MVTEDGYILNLMRLRHPNTKEDAKVVFLQHGILDSADCWFVNSPDKAPALKLAREGFDVWLGN